ncbi:hypothetical protein ACFXTO_032241 [Malus domestica]
MSFTILSMRAQPILAYPSVFPLGPASKRPAYPTFQQPMRPIISSFLSIASLARVKSNSPKGMSHATRLALRPNATIRDPSRTSCPSSGPCYDISSAHAELTPDPCQLTCRTTPTVAPQ